MFRPFATRVMIAVEVMLGLLTMWLTWSLLRDPTGNSVEFPANVLLVGTPFESYLWPALVLFAIAGALPIGVAIGSLLRASWAPAGHVVVGLCVTGWAITQGLLAGLTTVNQLVFIFIGFALIGLALTDVMAERKARRAEMLAAE